MTYVDAHHHFWNPARGDYGWMPDDDPILSKAYGPSDLSQALEAAGVNQTVLVQAAPTVHETEYLLGIADACSSVAKVVGWIDFEDPLSVETLRRLAQHPKFAGVRPMIQDLPDDDWMLRPDIQWAYEALIELNLTFDCLGFPRHLANFHTLLTRYPELRAVIDHCMKPQISDDTDAHFKMWAEGLGRLAEDTGVFCKLSGLVTEADTNCTVATLKPYSDFVIKTFGAERVMWGSDWPVVRLRTEYAQWYGMSTELTAHLTAPEHQQIFAGSARRFYQF